jgi:hypothetical protein
VPFDNPFEVLISCSFKKGPEEPRLRFRPVRLGTVTLSSTLLVVTGVESKRLAKGSSGRSETEMSNLSSSLSLAAGSTFDRRPCGTLIVYL